MFHVRSMTIGLLLFAGGVATAAPPSATEIIDRRMVEGWEKAKITPAQKADDQEYVRRVYLDLAGRIPSVTEVRQFLDDKRADKRAKLVDKLLSDWNYANHFTNVWQNLLVPEANSSLQARFQMPGFQGWLRNHLHGNTGYGEMVKELITAPLSLGRDAGIGLGNDGPSPSAFYFAKELMPENLAAAASRVFLGVKLECAQCHNHPFAQWKRDEFWSMAAFFSGVKRQGPGEIVVPGREDMNKREISIPDTDRKVQAKFLDGKTPEWNDGASTRETLANWITQRENPYFAKATVNRMWSYFFGRGLVDPVDEMVGADAVTSFPELLNELSAAFAESKFDLKFLIRSIVLSKPYQLSSKAENGSLSEAGLFARMPLRGLTAEQLFDSVSKAVGYIDNSPNTPPGVVINGGGSRRTEFVSRFSSSGDKTTEHQTSILQALALMNGGLVTDAMNIETSRTLAGVIDAPFLDLAGKIETLHLAALSRRPTEKESARYSKFIADRVKGASDAKQREQLQSEALADVFWTLLNSAEFMLNH